MRLDEAGTVGFTVTVGQLLAEKALWIPSLDVYVTAGDRPVPLAEHLASLEARKGQRMLDRLRAEPEATLAQYTARWEDMGHPAYSNPQPRGPGHIVGLAWDSAIHKFGVDRGAGVWSDEGNPDKVRFWFAFGELGKGVGSTWKSQRLADGLPLLTTTFEEDGVRYEVEQFAYPLNGPPSERRGDVPMVLLQQLTIRELRGTARELPVSMTHRRQLPPYFDGTVVSERKGEALLFRERGRGGVLLSVEGVAGPYRGAAPPTTRRRRSGSTPPRSSTCRPTARARSWSSCRRRMVPGDQVATLTAIDYAAARAATIDYWSKILARGAQFRVPEPVVNDLFRASLWHALRLPRRHGGTGDDVRIDLPYSNFAYSQVGTPWPVNQAVYVDYMLYGLRGYHAIASEELQAQFRNNQEADGHVSGYANWHVYTPAMLYAVAQNYLLSQDRAASIGCCRSRSTAMDWCLSQLERSARAGGDAGGLVRGPLNDLTGQGVWAFNQAYLFAGLDLFGRALERHGHARAAEARAAAARFRDRDRAGFRGSQRPFAAGPATRRHLGALRACRSADATAIARSVVRHRRGHRRGASAASQGAARDRCTGRCAAQRPRGQPLLQRAGALPTSRSTTSTRPPTCCATSPKRWCARSTATSPARSATQRSNRWNTAGRTASTSDRRAPTARGSSSTATCSSASETTTPW